MRKATPILAGLAVLLAYAGWAVLRPEASSAPGWGVVADPLAARIRAFLFGDSLWMGASYAVSAGFTAFALSVFRENRRRAAIGAAGGIAIGGAVYGLGCFFLGCCGSPMLAVYISLLGAKWAKITGPLLFGVTVATVALGVRMLRRRRRCYEGTCDEGGQG